jgi:hypothetical protein
MGLKNVVAAGVVAALTTAGVVAQEAPAVETALNGSVSVSLHLHPFLTDEELATLRLVLTNDQALDLFLPKRTGFATLAMSPEDGFVRDGGLVPSAQALADLPDANAARTAATSACDALRKGASPCVVVLDIAPSQ